MAYARVLVLDVDETKRRPAIGRELLSGLRAGQVAGCAMIAVLMTIFSVFLGRSPFYPLEVVAASVLGDSAIGRVDARTILVGALVHQLGPALVWGLIFGVVVWVTKPKGSLALMRLGLLIGALAQVVDVYVLLPLLAGGLAGSIPIFEPMQHNDLWLRVPAVASWVAHLTFGIALSLYPWKYDPVAGSFG